MLFTTKMAVQIIDVLVRDNPQVAANAFRIWKENPGIDPVQAVSQAWAANKSLQPTLNTLPQSRPHTKEEAEAYSKFIDDCFSGG